MIPPREVDELQFRLEERSCRPRHEEAERETENVSSGPAPLAGSPVIRNFLEWLIDLCPGAKPRRQPGSATRPREIWMRTTTTGKGNKRSLGYLAVRN